MHRARPCIGSRVRLGR